MLKIINLSVKIFLFTYLDHGRAEHELIEILIFHGAQRLVLDISGKWIW